jgi:hypothetical protein
MHLVMNSIPIGIMLPNLLASKPIEQRQQPINLTALS